MYILSSFSIYSNYEGSWYWLNYAKRVQQSLHWWYHHTSHPKWGGYGNMYGGWWDFWKAFQRKPLTPNGEKIVDLTKRAYGGGEGQIWASQHNEI